MTEKTPFKISFSENSQLQTKEIHLSFTDTFKDLEQSRQLKFYQDYIEYLIAQAQLVDDEINQKGIITILEITEQLFPHLKEGSIPLHETIIVEFGENAEGASLEDLLKGDEDTK